MSVQLGQKLRNVEKLEIKEKLSRLNTKIKGLERSFRETLETLTGTKEAPYIGVLRSRTRPSYDRVATEPIDWKNKEKRGYLKEKGRKGGASQDLRERGPQEVYREYLAESKIK